MRRKVIIPTGKDAEINHGRYRADTASAEQLE
jgi:hypothetical protein